jgi:hypothetical protein
MARLALLLVLLLVSSNVLSIIGLFVSYSIISIAEDEHSTTCTD